MRSVFAAAALLIAVVAAAALGPAFGADEPGAAPPRVKSHLRTSPGKPTAPIAIGYAFSAQPVLGTPFDVRITASAQGMTDLTLTVRGDEGLDVRVPVLETSSADGGERSWTVTATPMTEGTVYLSVLVQGRRGTEQPARDLLIPVRIGTAAPDKTQVPEAKPDAAGERVIVLPADSSR